MRSSSKVNVAASHESADSSAGAVENTVDPAMNISDLPNLGSYPRAPEALGTAAIKYCDACTFENPFIAQMCSMC